MKFKKLEVETERKGIGNIIKSQHFKKSIIAILVGAIAGAGIFYFTEGRYMETLVFGDMVQSLLLGAFVGFFITNSPCARSRC